MGEQKRFAREHFAFPVSKNDLLVSISLFLASKSELLVGISLFLVSKRDLLANISLFLVGKSDLIMSISIFLWSKRDLLANISLFLMRKRDLLANISLFLVGKSVFLVRKSDFLVADNFATIYSWHVIEDHEMRLFDDVVVWPVGYRLYEVLRNRDVHPLQFRYVKRGFGQRSRGNFSEELVVIRIHLFEDR